MMHGKKSVKKAFINFGHKVHQEYSRIITKGYYEKKRKEYRTKQKAIIFFLLPLVEKTIPNLDPQVGLEP